MAVQGADHNTQIVIATFAGPDTADQALESLRRLDREGWVRTIDAAVIARSPDGFVTVRDAQNETVLRDTLAGAVAGGLIGMLGGPVVATAGAVAGAAAAGTSSSLLHYAFAPEDLATIAASLPPGTSAIVAVGEPTVAEKIESELDKLEGEVIRRALRDEAIADLKGAPAQIHWQLQSRIQQLNRQIDELREKLATASDAARSDLRQRLETLRKERDEARSKMSANLEERARALEERRDNLLRESREKADAAKADVDRQVRKVQTMVALARADIAEAYRTQLEQRRAELARLDQDLASVRAEVAADLAAERAAIEEDIRKARADLEAARAAEEAAIRSAVDQLQAARVNAAREELQQIDNDLVELENALERARRDVKAQEAALSA